MLLLAAAVRGTLGVPVHPGDPQPRLASRHPPARVLSRGRKGQETHAVQPHPLAPQSPGRLQGPAQGRNRHFGPGRPGGIHHSPRTAARSRRRRPRHPAPDRARPHPRTGRQPLPRPRRRHGRRAPHRSHLQARHRQGPLAREAASSLGEGMDLGEVGEDELYTALDWLCERQAAVETALARRHLHGGTLVLYDVSSSYVEGRCCELARRGYNRDRKRGKLQIVYGLLCAPDGCPVAVAVFAGDTADPMTLYAKIAKLKERFGLAHVVLVGDRGLITQARIDQDLAPAGLDWITALRAPAIRALVAGGELQLSLFDERDMAAITAPDYPGERLIVCRNPDLARERARKREDLLQATERDLAKVARAVTRARKPLRSRADIGLAPGAVLNRHKMAKHFELTITDDAFRFSRNTAAIAAEAALDGFYVVRTSLPAATLDDAGTVRAYKSLAQVERAFRSLKGIDLRIRPLFHWLAPRVRAHVFLCLLAYHVEWHMRRQLAPMLYDDDDRTATEALRESIVRPAQRSPAALSKQTRGITADGLPVHSFRSLVADLATLTRNTVETAIAGADELTVYARPTPLQTRAFALLGISPERTQ